MAKSRSRRTRVAAANANHRLRSSTTHFPRSPSLTPFEDRRTWFPDPYRPAKLFSGQSNRITTTTTRKRSQSRPSSTMRLSWGREIQAFSAPQSTLICVRRGIRREVMHAKRKAGKSGQRKPRYNEHSKVSCKRRK